MKKRSALDFVVTCLVLGLVGLALWYSIPIIQAADANVQASIVGLFGLLLTGLVTNAYTKRREINARHFSEKREAYGKIIDIVVEAMSSAKSGRSAPTKNLTNKMIGYKKELMVWGGSEVIQLWNQFELESAKESTDPNNALVLMEKVLRALREDLGHDDHGLEFGNLIGLFIVAKDKKIIFGLKE